MTDAVDVLSNNNWQLLLCQITSRIRPSESHTQRTLRLQAELDDTQAADIAAVRDRTVTQAVGFPADLAEQICARIDACYVTARGGRKAAAAAAAAGGVAATTHSIAPRR